MVIRKWPFLGTKARDRYSILHVKAQVTYKKCCARNKTDSRSFLLNNSTLFFCLTNDRTLLNLWFIGDTFLPFIMKKYEVSFLAI